MKSPNQESIEENRYERKFLVSNSSQQEVERIIKYNPAFFSEIFYKRRVNNLYLDSEEKHNYFDNVDGNVQRLKIRIRWYGNLFGFIENPILELKIKNGEVGRKIAFPLKSFSLNEDFSKESLWKIFDKSSLPSDIKEILRACIPSLLNSYQRKYFISYNKKYRITLDDDLIFFEIKSQGNFFNYKREEKDIVILELKYNLDNDLNAQNITQYFPFRLTKSSKYVSGVDLLNF
ncbi:VTC domain-containing protein [Nanoarchaeota archaeon]